MAAAKTADGDEGLQGVGATGKAPRTRLKDAESLDTIYKKLVSADDESARNRASVDAMFDGEPPYDDAELEAAGQSQRCNLDFGEGLGALDAALTGYYDLTNSVDVLARVYTTHGADAAERAEWEQVMSEEVHRTIKEWSEFESLFQRLCTEIVKHGVGIVFHPNDATWQFESSGWSGFRIPRTTKASEEKIEIAIAERTYPVHELYRFIDRAQVDPGWNIKEVERALVLAKNPDSKNVRRDWEALQRDLKNNDLGASYEASKGVKVIHAWVREFSGKVSHYISLQNGSNADFLYKKADRFPSMSACFTIFTYGVGNGYYSSIRGLGYRIFPSIQVCNRLRGQAVDGAMFASSVMVQPENEKASQDLELTYVGPYAVLPPNFKVIPVTLPNVANQVLPVIQDLSMLVQNNTGSYRPRAVASDGQERTAKEVTLQAQHEAMLSTAALNLFYLPWGRLLTSVVMRLVSSKLRVEDQGGKEAAAFIKRCLARGVPKEALDKIDRVDPVRAIGYGSAAMRGMAFDEMLTLAGSLDELGKNRLLRDKFASKLGGYHAVDAYLPRLENVSRQPVDAKIAEFENSMFRRGEEMSVRDGENDAVHAAMHAPLIIEAMAAIDEALQTEQPDWNALQQIVTFLRVAVPHTAQHTEKVLADPLHEKEAKQLKQLLQHADAKTEAATAGLQKALAAQQEQAAAEQAQQPPQADPKTQKMLQESQTKQQIAVQESQSKLQQKAMESQQRMGIRDVQAAQKMRQSREKSEQARAFPTSAASKARAPRAK